MAHVDASFAGLHVAPIEVASAAVKFDLAFSFTEAEGAAGLTGTLEYSADLFDRESAQRLGARLLQLLEQIAGDASLPFHAFDMLLPDERARVLHGFNRTAPDDARVPAADLVERFEHHVAATPERIALNPDCGFAPNSAEPPTM